MGPVVQHISVKLLTTRLVLTSYSLTVSRFIFSKSVSFDPSVEMDTRQLSWIQLYCFAIILSGNNSGIISFSLSENDNGMLFYASNIHILVSALIT